MTEILTENAIEGLEINSDENCYLYRITELSDQIKQLIKSQIVSIWEGELQEYDDPEYYSLKNTVSSFLDRYRDKSENTKKGMIGELLSHVLINNFVDDLKPLSIMKNKEERSIRKGFDIIYYDTTSVSVWYSEVKSGKKTVTDTDVNRSINRHLNDAKNSIHEMFSSGRRTLWESALIDVKLTIEESSSRKDLSDILKDHSTNYNPDSKNVVLISVLYHDLNEITDLSFLQDYLTDLVNEELFESHIILSIQKNTYQAVESFLIELAREND